MIPLPYSNILWKAGNAGEWCTGMMDLTAAGLTLEGAMTCHTRPTKDGIPLYRRRLGPYARHVMVLTVLRGIVEYGQGKPRGGYITKRWVLGTAPEGTVPTERLALHDWIIRKYTQMLDYVRIPLLFRVIAHFVIFTLISHFPPPYFVLCSGEEVGIWTLYVTPTTAELISSMMLSHHTGFVALSSTASPLPLQSTFPKSFILLTMTFSRRMARTG